MNSTGAFSQHGNVQFEKGDFLWRYIDMHRFLDMTTNSRLHFSRLDKMNDPFEGVSYQELLNHQSDEHQREYYRAKSFEVLSKGAGSGVTQLEKDIHAFKLRQKSYLANSWFLESRESIAMWNQYADKGGVALKILPDDLISFLRESSNFQTRDDVTRLLYGLVEYRDYTNPNSRRNSFKTKVTAFRKDESWKHEREFRLVLYSKRYETMINNSPLEKGVPEGGADLYVKNPSAIKFQCVFHPDMSDWMKINYRNVIGNSKLKDSISFVDSELKILKDLFHF
jgi:hypothetical protein